MNNIFTDNTRARINLLVGGGKYGGKIFLIR